MIFRQEENSSIGDYFHDSGAWTLFNALSSTVDDFEIDTEQMFVWCDRLITSLKGLQSMLKKCEKEQIKKQHEREVDNMINRGVE